MPIGACCKNRADHATLQPLPSPPAEGDDGAGNRQPMSSS
eukprot:CAMPEP_0115524798 /NCGR_PEP_ID=MMETSP0271-20121206/81381_1 /TAXON_ID=71861 /ORGANISM="Scrippsiella trochoidea, Strain CCMP3099" /LENGTH=39 /DNA_ID= /DNA_START= /DNA_END= /DNA_ORIENTATION=